MHNEDKSGLGKNNDSNKNGIVLAISAAAVIIVGALLAIAVKIRRSKE